MNGEDDKIRSSMRSLKFRFMLFEEMFFWQMVSLSALSFRFGLAKKSPLLDDSALFSVLLCGGCSSSLSLWVRAGIKLMSDGLTSSRGLWSTDISLRLLRLVRLAEARVGVDEEWSTMSDWGLFLFSLIWSGLGLSWYELSKSKVFRWSFLASNMATKRETIR